MKRKLSSFRQVVKRTSGLLPDPTPFGHHGSSLLSLVGIADNNCPIIHGCSRKADADFIGYIVQGGLHHASYDVLCFSPKLYELILSLSIALS